MGFLDALKKLTKPYAEDDFLGEEYDERSVRGSAFPQREVRSYEDYAAAPAPAEPAPHRSFIPSIPNIPAMRSEPRAEAPARQQPMKLVVMRPERFEDAAAIADQMRRRSSIVLNLEATPRETARRLVDFLSGAAYALEGRIRRIAAGTYIITPANVDLTGDEFSAFETGKENYF